MFDLAEVRLIRCKIGHTKSSFGREILKKSFDVREVRLQRILLDKVFAVRRAPMGLLPIRQQPLDLNSHQLLPSVSHVVHHC